MSESERPASRSPSPAVEEVLRRPHLFVRLMENALTVAQSLQGNYFSNTATFIDDLQRSLARDPSLMRIDRADDLVWDDVQNEVVTFIDGGVGQAQIASQVPLLLRVGSYCVKTGEHVISERERFGYYPIILGDLEGGSKDRRDFVDIVRITAELLGGLSALDRTDDLRVLMFHGPLVYLVSSYSGHTPFTEADINLFLGQYALTPDHGRDLKEAFLEEARLDIYPAMMPERADHLIENRMFEPLAWMAFLYRRLIETARSREPIPVIAGVVERGRVREFSERVLLQRIFRRLRKRDNIDYFNEMFGRTDLTSEQSLLERLGYTDTLLLGMLLQPGEYSEPWAMQGKFEGLRGGDVRLPHEGWTTRVNWQPLAPGGVSSFPSVAGCYLQVSLTTEPIRVEVFPDLGSDQIVEAVRRSYLYARLLPGYGFPVGLDIADKHAHVPAWLTEAYGKLIRYNLSASLQRGEISDAEMRRVLVQAIYMTNRDWLFRPDV